MPAKIVEGVPLQVEGSYHDTESVKEFTTLEEANQVFAVLVKRLLDINVWHTYGGHLSADFKVFDSNAEPVFKEPKVGNYVRIKIPAPPNPNHDGYDWVTIQKIGKIASADYPSWIVQLKPSCDPKNPNKEELAHFYKDCATANIVVSQEGKTIKSAVYGRNEVVNKQDLGVLEGIRNTVIAVSGKLGISKIQWKVLAEGLLNFDE